MYYALERLVAGCLIILFFAVLLLITAIVFIDAPGIPFFTQKRVGRDGEIFPIYKFRTMRGIDVLTDKDALKRHKNNRGRITRTGRILRKYGIDESLQLINILKGEMQFVGPRPNPAEHVNKETYTPITKSVLPGLTGICQTFPRKYQKHLRMIQAIERDYEDRRTLLSDAWIWARTIRALLRGDHE